MRLAINEAAPATIRPGEIRIVSEVTEYLDGTPMIHRETRRGREVPTGTYWPDVRACRPAWRLSEPRPIDRLVGIGRKQPFAMPSSSGAAAAGVIGLPALTGAAGRRGFALGQPARRGPGQLAEWLNARGFSLSMTPAGKLLVRSPGGRWPTDEERRAYIDGAPLLAGWLAGKPLRCELFHKDPVEAVTVVDLDIDVCEEHAA